MINPFEKYRKKKMKAPGAGKIALDTGLKAPKVEPVAKSPFGPPAAPKPVGPPAPNELQAPKPIEAPQPRQDLLPPEPPAPPLQMPTPSPMDAGPRALSEDLRSGVTQTQIDSAQRNKTNEDLLNDAIRKMLTEGQNIEAQEQSIRDANSAQLGQSLADARARNGAYGMAGTGAASAIDADIRGQSARSLAETLIANERANASESRQDAGLAASVLSDFRSNDIAAQQAGNENDVLAIALDQLGYSRDETGEVINNEDLPEDVTEIGMDELQANRDAGWVFDEERSRNSDYAWYYDPKTNKTYKYKYNQGDA